MIPDKKAQYHLIILEFLNQKGIWKSTTRKWQSIKATIKFW